MPRRSTRIPKYCLHKGTRQAYVTHDVDRHYLGVHGSDESIERYNRFVGEMVASSPVDLPRQQSGFQSHSKYDHVSSIRRQRLRVSMIFLNFGNLAKGTLAVNWTPSSSSATSCSSLKNALSTRVSIAAWGKRSLTSPMHAAMNGLAPLESCTLPGR